MILWIVWAGIALTACTFSYQNIKTHGKASETMDENQDVSPKTESNIKISTLRSRPYANGPKGTNEFHKTLYENGPKAHDE